MNLSNQVAVLEQENERLSRLADTLGKELETLKQNPPAGEMEQAKDYLIDLLAPDIIWAEENLKSMGPKQRERVTEIVTVYRTVRPKEGDKGEASD
jgi:hypothetical protein